jgi:glycosyltransferase involved in cell wall biosynthesis
MKVLQTMPDIDREASGPTYSVTKLCESLLLHGCEVKLALVGASNLAIKQKYIQPFPPGMGPARLGGSPKMRRWLSHQVGSGMFDLVHNHSLWMLSNVYPGWVTRGKSIPYVVSPRGTLSAWAMASGSKIKSLFWPLIQRPAIKHAMLFHATSELEYLDIRRLGFRQPIAVIPNGIELPPIQPKPIRNRRTLLFFGRLHPVKGIDSLLRSWVNLQDEFPEWDLKIVGPGDKDYVHYLRTMVSRHALQRVVFSEPIYGNAKYDAYRQADLYVLPSKSENFAMTVAESLSCGTPCVVSQGAPWQALETEVAGWWPKLTDSALLEALRQALAMPQQELDAMGENGRLWMKREFSWNHIGSAMLSVYEWILGKGELPSCVIKD